MLKKNPFPAPPLFKLIFSVQWGGIHIRDFPAISAILPNLCTASKNFCMLFVVPIFFPIGKSDEPEIDAPKIPFWGPKSDGLERDALKIPFWGHFGDVTCFGDVDFGSISFWS